MPASLSRLLRLPGHRHPAGRRALWLAVVAMLSPSPAPAAVTAVLADLTMEQLMNESVTSVSKKQTNLYDAAAAISVITSEDIMRLGITSIPEALRLVPGLDVARVNSNDWAISSRGFNRDFSNKLLVLMDGRSVFTPSFGGVNWKAQDMVLEDLDRIEVIRGPGATLWGANAVNGVINITSKSSKDTQGFLVSTAVGTEEQPLTSIRYGGEVNPGLHYRTYLQYFNRDEFSDLSGGSAGDSWDSIRGGFRSDWQASVQDLVTVQGDVYTVGSGGNLTIPTFVPPYTMDQPMDNTSRGGNLLGRWTRTFDETSHLSVQSYFDYFHTEIGESSESRRTADVQLEHRLPFGSRNDVVWGIGYRFTSDDFNNSPSITWNPTSRGLNILNTFLQDEITLVPDHLRLTLGSKFEHNDYTGWETQPSARLIWKPSAKHSVWTSFSHAVSTPSRIAAEGRINTSVFPTNTGALVQTAALGNHGVVSEELDAFEAGYRMEVTPDLSFDLVTFYNRYDHITGIEAGTPVAESRPVPHLLVPLDFASTISGDTYGGELSVQWRPAEYWKITASYSLLQMRLSPEDGTSHANPQQQAGLRSYLALPWNLELNGAAYFVDQVEPKPFNGSPSSIPAYLRADIGLVWHATPTLDLGIWGYNLLDGGHPEFISQFSRQITEVPRSIMAKLTWRF
jgi:iron complex outermembrane receptor protein